MIYKNIYQNYFFMKKSSGVANPIFFDIFSKTYNYGI